MSAASVIATIPFGSTGAANFVLWRFHWKTTPGHPTPAHAREHAAPEPLRHRCDFCNGSTTQLDCLPVSMHSAGANYGDEQFLDPWLTACCDLNPVAAATPTLPVPRSRSTCCAEVPMFASDNILAAPMPSVKIPLNLKFD